MSNCLRLAALFLLVFSFPAQGLELKKATISPFIFPFELDAPLDVLRSSKSWRVRGTVSFHDEPFDLTLIPGNITVMAYLENALPFSDDRTCDLKGSPVYFPKYGHAFVAFEVKCFKYVPEEIEIRSDSNGR